MDFTVRDSWLFRPNLAKVERENMGELEGNDVNLQCKLPKTTTNSELKGKIP